MFKAKMIALGAKFGGAIKAFAILHAPTAAVIAGGALVVWALVETAKAASKPNDELEEAVEELEEVNDKLQEDTTPEEHATLRKDKRRALRHVGKAWFKQYKKPVILATAGLAAIAGGYLWAFRRFTAAVAEAAAATAALATVDRNCRRTFGDNLTNALYSENYDPEAFSEAFRESIGNYNEDGHRIGAGTAHDDIATLSRETLGSEDHPEYNLYHWNRLTVEDGDYTKGIVDQIMWLKSRVNTLQNQLDTEPKRTFMSRGYILNELGLHSATVHPDTPDGRREADKDLTWGVHKGEKIRVGLDDLFRTVSVKCNDPEWVAYLEENYDDIIVKLDVNPDSYYKAALYSEAHPTFIGTIPKKFRSTIDKFRDTARVVGGGRKQAITG